MRRETWIPPWKAVGLIWISGVWMLIGIWQSVRWIAEGLMSLARL